MYKTKFSLSPITAIDNRVILSSPLPNYVIPLKVADKYRCISIGNSMISSDISHKYDE